MHLTTEEMISSGNIERLFNGSYAAFGKVVKGIEIVDEIAETPVGFDGQTPKVTPVIESMVVL